MAPRTAEPTRTGSQRGGRDTVTVVIADDRPVLRAGLRTALSSVASVTADTSLSGLVATTRADRPDVLVVGVAPDDTEPFDAVARATTRHPELRVLALTDTTSVVTLRRALLAGVDSVLLTDATLAQIADAVVATAGGERVVAPGIAMALATGSQGDPSQATGGLSARELQILTLLADGLTNREVGEEFELSSRAVKTHVQRLFRGLDVSDRTAAVAEGLRQGLIH